MLAFLISSFFNDSRQFGWVECTEWSSSRSTGWHPGESFLMFCCCHILFLILTLKRPKLFESICALIYSCCHQEDFYAVVDWAHKTDPLRCISMHGITERYLSGQKADAAGFVRRLLDDLETRISDLFTKVVASSFFLFSFVCDWVSNISAMISVCWWSLPSDWKKWT